jgi:pyridoxamine 5'-phosphate oxidase
MPWIVLTLGKKRIKMLDKILADCSTEWSKTKTNKKHPYRYFYLATVDKEGLPEVRTVVLRKFDPKQLLFTIYTDARTPKITSLIALPFAELLFYDARKLTQLRVRAKCIEQSKDEVAFSQQHENAQKDYTTNIAPGQPIKSMDEVTYLEENHFVKLVFKAEKIDFLKLMRPNHQRAIFEFKDDQWKGKFVTP